MPRGFQRINVKKSQPNDNIVFIKPLEGPGKPTAQIILERIAAQCLPIMREHHLSVLSLEEYESNPEFVGRNFNAGEVIQLVLKSRSGKWLPFDYIQMVMMHELAHNKQMNHSKAFWAVRNNYADQMRTLWSRGYTGDGVWGRGTLLETGDYAENMVLSAQDLPQHSCGGTYRSRGRKRKPKQRLSYQEAKKRRILKKFGANGVALGADEDVKVELEKGKKPQGKPRVASSKRGRELRAAAALARFDGQKKAEEAKESQDDVNIKAEDGSGSETVSDSEDEAAMDINGHRLVDNKGHGMVKVCEDENGEDEDVKNELRELIQSTIKFKPEKRESPTLADIPYKTQPTTSKEDEKGSKKDIEKPPSGESSSAIKQVNGIDPPNSVTGVCAMCGFDNGPKAHICDICSHVLDSSKVKRTWKCKSEVCRDNVYLNAGDAGLCGVCGHRKDT